MFKRLLALGTSTLLVAALFTTGFSTAALAETETPDSTTFLGSAPESTVDSGVAADDAPTLLVAPALAPTPALAPAPAPASAPNTATPITTQVNYTCVSGTIVDGSLNLTGGNYTWTVTFPAGLPGMYNPGVANSTQPGFYTSSDYANYSGTIIVKAKANAGYTLTELSSDAVLDGASTTATWTFSYAKPACVAPRVCAASDFSSPYMWELTWGYDFEHRNGGAAIFSMQSNGGLMLMNDAAVPSYMNSTWHWLYVSKDQADKVWKYSFADGTVRTATITGADCTPTIVWATYPPVADATAAALANPTTCQAASVAFALQNATWADPVDVMDGSRVANADYGHTFANGSTQVVVNYTKATQTDWKDAACRPFFEVEQSCGFVKITFHNESKWDRWPDTHYTNDGVAGNNAGSGTYYSAHKVSPGTTAVIFEKTFTEDFGGGMINVSYQDILGAERDIDTASQSIQLRTDCVAPVLITTSASASFVAHTCSVLGSMTLKGANLTWTIVATSTSVAGPGGTVTAGVPSATYLGLLNPSAMQSATNALYYGLVTVTAVANSGYVLSAPFSQTVNALKPTGCDAPPAVSPVVTAPAGTGGNAPVVSPVTTAPTAETPAASEVPQAIAAPEAELQTESSGDDAAGTSTQGTEETRSTASGENDTMFSGWAFFAGLWWLWILLLILVAVVTRIIRRRYARRTS